MTERGIVLEVNGNECTVISRDGIVHKISRNKKTKVGQEIIINVKTERNFSQSVSLIAAVFMFFIICSACLYFLVLNNSEPSISNGNTEIVGIMEEAPAFAYPGIETVIIPPEDPAKSLFPDKPPYGLYIGLASGVMVISAVSYIIYWNISKKKHQI